MAVTCAWSVQVTASAEYLSRLSQPFGFKNFLKPLLRQNFIRYKPTIVEQAVCGKRSRSIPGLPGCLK